MENAKYIGIWMDHSKANLIEFTDEPASIQTIESNFTHEEKEQSLRKGEKLMHNKEQQQQGEFYNAISEIILKYKMVLLFGPTNAKVELFNQLKADTRFNNINIETASTDKLTENQQYAYVKKHFSNHLFPIM